MIQIRHTIFTFLFCLFLFSLTAQQSNTLYFLEDIHQSSFLNPAFSPGQGFVVGLPFISGINIGFNNDFKIKDATQPGNGLFSDTLRFDFNTFYENISNQNKARFDADVSVFYAGIRSGKNFFSVSVNEKGYFRGQFDKSFVEYFKKGPKSYYGGNSELGGLSFDIGQYREVGFAVARKANKKLAYGVRLKLLFGKMNFSSGKLDFKIHSQQGEDLLFEPSGEVAISGPLTFVADTVDQSVRIKRDLQTSDYFFNFKNLGMGMDLGFQYKATEQFSFSASIIGSGFLKFSKKNFVLNAENTLAYGRDSLTQALDPSAPDYLSGNSAIYAFRDSIPFMATARWDGETQWANLPVVFYAGANYRVNKNLSVGIVQKIYVLKGFSSAATTVAVNSEVAKNLKVTGTYTMMSKSFFNLGFGGIYEARQGQFYLSTDNIFSLVNPSGVKNLTLHFGINLLIGKD